MTNSSVSLATAVWLILAVIVAGCSIGFGLMAFAARLSEIILRGPQ